MSELSRLGLNPLNRTLTPVVQDIPVMPQHSAVTQLQMRTRPYEHPMYRNPGQSFNPNDAFNNTFKSWAHGIYNLPGELASGAINMALAGSPWETSHAAVPGQVASKIDQQIGTDYLNQNYTPQSGWQNLVSAMGSLAPEAALGVMPLSGRMARELGGEIVNQAVKPSMSKQAGMIGGVNAKNADLAALSKAQEMKSEGIDADTIYQDTKWWLDHPDGKPRFEIDDSGAGLSNNARRDIKDYGVRREESFMPHDELYGAYPDTADISVMHTSRADNGSSGAYHRDDDSISLNLSQLQGDPDLKSTNLHELQHAIQHREGMARGGSPESFERAKDVKKEIDRQRRELEGNFGFNEWFDDLVQNNRSKYDELIAEGAAKDYSVMPLYNEFASTIKEKPYRGYFSRQMRYLEDEVKSLGRTPYIDPNEGYKRLAGETEARLVQDRMDMPMSERLSNPFFQNYDVPLDKQIVRYGDGTNLSRNGEKALP